MQALSPFQLLPDHIVQLVVHHLVGSTRTLSRVSPSSEEHKLLLLPLMWVCQNFRAIASVNFYRVNTVTCRGDYYDIERTEYHWSYSLRKFYRKAHHLAQEVRIQLSKQSVFYGDALKALAKMPCKDCAFPQARKLTFVFFVSHGHGLSPHDVRIGQSEQQQLEYEAAETAKVEANLGAFIEQIKQMAPMVREIEVENRDTYYRYPETEYFGALLVRLVKLTSRIMYRIRDEAGSVELLADDISDLVHIDVESRSIDPVAQLARQSAMTLQSLAIRTNGGGDAIGLIEDADGNYAEYPRLRVLKLRHGSGDYRVNKPVFHGAVPFPRLRHLTMDDYPFGDDVVFRGNADALEYLDMKALWSDTIMLMKHSLFVPTSHPKLQYVKFELHDRLVLDPFVTVTAYLQFLLNIGPNAAVRGLPSMTWNNKISAALSLFGDYPSIQVLYFENTHVQLWDAITIVESLPLLSDLHCESLDLGTLPIEVTEDELPTYVVSKYAQMGKRFRCCHVYCTSGKLLKEVVVCVLLLALICPSFDYCVPPVGYYKYFMDHMRRTIDSDEFKDHAPRLRRLFTK
ncbi:hypothetical protein FBU31_001088 [Coemansia sp. 'formosensis']|nr:hypothetical protein FBU31_001088 [Coemansia sp. 'formosensis']